MEEVYRQLFSLLIFSITGIVIGGVFDVFRILRKSFKTADFITYFQDILFWILTGGIVLFTIFKFNNGEVRSYIFLGIAFGLLLYMLTISKFFVKYAVMIIGFVKKWLSYPICFIIKMVQKLMIQPTKKLFKTIMGKQREKKTLQKTSKNDRKNKKIQKKSINFAEKKGIFGKM